MADDLVLNLAPAGDAGPVQQKFKYIGGSWRDRRRAKKKDLGKATSNGPATGPNAEDPSFPSSDRPLKRQRTDEGGVYRLPGAAGGRSGAGGGDPNFQVASKLFTSNPAAKTVFEDVQQEADPELTKPSNAPLSGEASNFHALGLSRRIAQHLSAKLEMKAPTSIQKNTIPQLIEGDDDAFLQAQTGSGKTLAYLLPIVQRILALTRKDDGSPTGADINRNSGLFAIVLAPTRELCKQISVVLEKLLRCCPWIVSTSVMGGESKHSEKARIRKGCNILIATPGRLTDHLDNTQTLDVGTVRWLVLDEGDRMMEMGFEQDLKKIVTAVRKEPLKHKNKDGVILDESMPKRRVTVLCSATMKSNVTKLGEISLQDAIHITGSKDGKEEELQNDAVFAAPAQLKQAYLVVPSKLRLVTLIAYLKDAFARKGSVMKAIIFISCADSVDFHFDLLKSPAPAELPQPGSPTEEVKPSDPHIAGSVHPAAYITSQANPRILLHKLHGSLTQQARTSTLRSFSNAKDPAVLITTDISSRGLDVPSVELVIEYDPAFAVADHVHRIGRTARAGKPGKAALFLLPGCEEAYINLLPSTPPATAQSYETVLQRGFAAAIDMPAIPGKHNSDDGDDDHQARPQKQSPHARAEALQLHIEQRVLASEPPKVVAGKGRRQAPAPRPSSAGTVLIDAARQAFRSHIRAYATHVKDERHIFDIQQLHLGHIAKSYGLREAPGGIGGGVQKRSHKGKVGGGLARGPAGAGAGAAPAGGLKRKARGDSDDEGGGVSAVDEEAARKKMEQMLRKMNAASEFNIA
ncbi:ATP-dependent RNA helicase dbp-7 [Cytospora mali]|uniref:ATP-dependent RNA helicase n=1 Tax=Cytospora mali TaxID=578113 RepID=A0A194VI04_CYTMA|nr:ATP-dependent RNA helicase dbp-7 [Valsa mali]